MKRILIYGDSITWGRVPNKPDRYDESTRYAGVVQNELGPDCSIVAEGLRSRTLFGENGFLKYRNGFVQFGPIFASHLPLNLVVLFLGTNDTNSRAGKTTKEIAAGFDDYVKSIDYWCAQMQLPKPKILIVAPPKIKGIALREGSMFSGADEKADSFASEFSKKANELDADLFDAATYAEPSDEDGIHPDAESHMQLGKALATCIREIL